MIWSWKKKIRHPRGPLVTESDDFALEDFGEGGSGFVRYRQGSHSLTVPYDYEYRTGKRLLSLNIFRQRVTVIAIPSVLEWDDGNSMNATEGALVLGRISSILGATHRVVVNDPLYESLERQSNERASRSATPSPDNSNR